MDHTQQPPRVLSFCTGLRGLERGLIRAIGFIRTVAIVEIEAFIIYNLLQGMEKGLLDPAPIWTNCKTFDPNPFRGCVDILMGGYPCQPFSNAGLRNGVNDPRHLWPYLRRAAGIIQPPICFFENVYGHVTMGAEQVIQDLCSMGYRVEAGIFTASEVGHPHHRKRLFILAYRNGDGAGAGAGCAASQSSSAKGKTQRPEWYETFREWLRSEPWYGRQNMADSIGQGFQISRMQPSRDQQQTVERGRFVARPGESQHDWEEPRSIKSGVGCTVNGYNFREDFLRGLGNSVVEQTAELAFKTLCKKIWNVT